jgi:hypothetical protein
MKNVRNSLFLSIGAALLAIEILLFWHWDFAQASVIENDPQGFQGIRWGTDLNTLPNLVLVDQSDHIQTYVFVEQPPRFGEVSVESIKLLAIDQQLARVLIRYHGEQTHSRIVKFLESAFGKIDLRRGAMVRGLNQQYFWRGMETEINLTYHGFRERGYLVMQSRVLAPGFLDVLSDHGH